MLASEATIEIATSPADAWTQCQHGTVDLLIVDPNPESGPAAALVKSLYTSRRRIPVLVLTAYDTPRLRTQMRSLGVHHYLAKPVELRDLGQSVRIAVSDTTNEIAGQG